MSLRCSITKLFREISAINLFKLILRDENIRKIGKLIVILIYYVSSLQNSLEFQNAVVSFSQVNYEIYLNNVIVML